MTLSIGITHASCVIENLRSRGTQLCDLFTRLTPAVLLIFAVPFNAYAQSLTEAVNAQLANDPLPCARLLEGEADGSTFLTGGLADICARAVPQGSTSQSGGGGSTSPGTRAQGLHLTGSDDHSVLTATQQIDAQWNLFFNAEHEVLDRKLTVMEDGFDSDFTRLVLGGTYTSSRHASFTLAIFSAEQSGNYYGGGEFETNSAGAHFLAALRPSDDVYIHLAAGYDSQATEQTRNALFTDTFNSATIFSTSGTPQADYDTQQLSLAFEVGRNSNKGRVTFSPYLGANWVNNSVGTYSEAGDSGLELTIYDNDRRSLQSNLGLLTSMAITTEFGAFIPQFDLRWKHEFSDKSRTIAASFTGDTRAQRFNYRTEAADTDFFELGAGAVFVFTHGKQAFINLQTLLGHDYYDNYLVSAGINIEL